MEVRVLIYNWFYTTDGEGFEKIEVGKHGVFKIDEQTIDENWDRVNYLVTMADGSKKRIFNPNHVEYFTQTT